MTNEPENTLKMKSCLLIRGRSKSLMHLLTILLLGMMGTAEANPVDMRTVREVAVKFVNANTKTPLRGDNDLQLVTTYRTESDDAAFHIFNTPNGFVIVSADDCATPILGYSDEGRPFDLDNIPIQLQGYLQGFVEQIQYGIENHLEADEKTARQWELVRVTGRLNDKSDGGVVEPLVTALWGQGCCYNAMCPENPNGQCGHVLTGCAATAMGMIMHYWGYPSQGSGTHTYTPSGYPVQSVNFGATTYDWANMPDQLTETSTQDEIDAVSTLLWHCGVAINTRYGPVTSSAFSDFIPEALIEYFDYSEEVFQPTDDIYNENLSLWYTMIKNDLFLGRPILYMGVNPNYGHGWVCDGIDAQELLHFNWGWEGQNNGYYSLYAGIGYANQSAIFNIVPNGVGISTQSTALNQGWNWFSTNLDITLDDLKAALVETLPGTTIQIKGKDNSTNYNPSNNRWLGTLAWDVSRMYKIKVATDCEIALQGFSIDPANHPITIVNGANWIGFPLSESVSLTNAFAGFAINGDKIKSKNGTATYSNGRWQGSTLNTLVPGQGYRFISNTQEDRILTFPASTK